MNSDLLLAQEQKRCSLWRRSDPSIPWSTIPMSQMIMFQPDCRATQLQVIWILKLAQEMRLSLVSFTFRSSVYPTLPESYIIIHVTTRTPTLLTFHFHNVLALSQLEAARRSLVAFITPLYSGTHSLSLPFLSSPTSSPPNTTSPVSAFILAHYVLLKVSKHRAASKD